MSGHQADTGDEFDGIVAQLVDQPLFEAPPKLRKRVLSEQRLPVLAPWAKDVDEFRNLIRWLVEHYRHAGAYHLARVPLYAARVALRLPVGAVRLLVLAVTWARDVEGRVRLSTMHEDTDNKEYVKLAAMHRDSVRQRAALVGLAVLAAVGLIVALPTMDAPVRAAVVVAAVGGLSQLGASKDKPLVSRAVVATKAERLTADRVEYALRDMGAVKKDQEVSFPAPITRDGPGWRADIDLPPGVTAAEIVDKRDKLASSLRRSLGCVWPEAAPRVHPGRLVLWCADEDMADAKPAVWPLAKRGVVDVFAPVAFGVDQRGRPVAVTLMYASMVVGAVPRMGKTFSVRLLALAAALDARCELYLFDLKGGGDLGALEPVAHRYRAGDDEDDVAYAVQAMRELQADMRRRAKVVRELPRSVCPESKVTAQLADRRSLRLHPVLLAVDECQRWFEHPQHGKELESIAEDLVRRGPSFGIFAVFATQRPDAKSLPTGISGNAVLRYCLKVMDQVANDQVLGTSAYRAGIRATLFTRSDLGIGILAGEGDDPSVVRTYYVNTHGAEAVVERARQLREAAGTITGDAAGDTIDAGDVARLLVDVLAVVPAGDAKCWSETICDRLAGHRPDLYRGWTAAQLAAALKPYGVATGQVWATVDGQGANRRGVVRDDVVDALRRQTGPVSGVA